VIAGDGAPFTEVGGELDQAVEARQDGVPPVVFERPGVFPLELLARDAEAVEECDEAVRGERVVVVEGNGNAVAGTER
jgi:hypothetical protein